MKKKRTFRKFQYRGVDLDQLLDLSADQLMQLVHARARRRFSRGLKRKPLALMKKLRKAKKEAPALEKPAVVKTHLRNMIVLPDMIGSIVGVHNGKTFNQVEIKVMLYNDYYCGTLGPSIVEVLEVLSCTIALVQVGKHASFSWCLSVCRLGNNRLINMAIGQTTGKVQASLQVGTSFPTWAFVWSW